MSLAILEEVRAKLLDSVNPKARCGVAVLAQIIQFAHPQTSIAIIASTAKRSSGPRGAGVFLVVANPIVSAATSDSAEHSPTAVRAATQADGSADPRQRLHGHAARASTFVASSHQSLAGPAAAN